MTSGPGDLDCQIVPSGPGFEFQNNLKLFAGLLYAAQRKIIVVSPYFVPDEALLLAITTACQRGIHVELFVSEEGDQALVYHAQRSYYEALLRAGREDLDVPEPYILHTKRLTIDDEVAIIGSSNMDMRSFGLNMEISMLVRGEEFVRQMRASRTGTASSAASSPSTSGRSSRCARPCSTTSRASPRRCSRQSSRRIVTSTVTEIS